MTRSVVSPLLAERAKADFISAPYTLGAQARDVLLLVLGQGMTLAVGGVAVGVLLALALGRVVSTLLFGVSGRDPVTLAGVSAVLTIVALAACYIPARRAAHVDPLVALREE